MFESKIFCELSKVFRIERRTIVRTHGFRTTMLSEMRFQFSHDFVRLSIAQTIDFKDVRLVVNYHNVVGSIIFEQVGRHMLTWQFWHCMCDHAGW